MTNILNQRAHKLEEQLNILFDSLIKPRACFNITKGHKVKFLVNKVTQVKTLEWAVVD